MASDNPDGVIKNAIRTLVECKSRKEWGDVVKYDKRVGGELHMYQDYAEEVNVNSAVFVCDVDGFHQDDFVNTFAKQGTKLSKICLVRWSYLDRIQEDRDLLERFNTTVTKPDDCDPTARIFC
jgi:hypothetical protein